MRKQLYFVYSILFILLLFSCRKALKNLNDYFPTVKTASAIVNTDGDVVVTGKIVSPGEKALEYVGFCFDTLPEPKMLSNQIVSELNGADFTSTYKNFDPLKTYYFRTWAVNGNGYAYGDIIKLTNIKGTPVAPPCSLTVNYLDLGSGNGSSTYYNVSSPSLSFTWDIQANSLSSGTLNFKFGSKPRTKVFTTTTDSSPNSDQVTVYIYWGSINGALASGTKVYVNETSTDVFDISICQAPWQYNTTTFYLNTRFISPQ